MRSEYSRKGPMPDSRDTNTPTPPYGVEFRGRHRAELRGGSNEVERFNTQVLWVGLVALVVVVTTSAAGTTVMLLRPTWAIPVGIVQAAAAVIGIVIVTLSSITSANRPRAADPIATPASLPQDSHYTATEPAPNPDGITTTTSRTDEPVRHRDVAITVAARLRTLIRRAIDDIDVIERGTEDPVLLKGLYALDHLFVLALRQADNVAVLSGGARPRNSVDPVDIRDIQLAAAQETERYYRLVLIRTDRHQINGRGVSEIVHLLTELMENATRFTSPGRPKVEVHTCRVAAGLAVEIKDRGVGIPPDRRHQLNHLLATGSEHILPELVSKGHIGLAVVHVLARRHGIRVQLQPNVWGGTTAVAVIPPTLLVDQVAEQSQLPSDGVQRPSHSRRLDQLSPQPVLVASTADTGAVAPEAQTNSPPRPSPEQPPPLTGAPIPPREHAGRRQPAATVWPSRADERYAAEPPGRAQPRTRDAGDASGRTPAPDGVGDLPMRSPGTAYQALATGHSVDGTPALANPLAAAVPPPLPVREGTFLPPEMATRHEPPAIVPGHNTQLLSQVSRGRDEGMADQDTPDAVEQAPPPRPTTH